MCLDILNRTLFISSHALKIRESPILEKQRGNFLSELKSTPERTKTVLFSTTYLIVANVRIPRIFLICFLFCFHVVAIIFLVLRLLQLKSLNPASMFSLVPVKEPRHLFPYTECTRFIQSSVFFLPYAYPMFCLMCLLYLFLIICNITS